MSFLLASAARATVGARSGQEDAFRVWPAEGTVRPKSAGEGLLAVLADGMGGHAGGAVAGQTACATFAEVFVADQRGYEERLRNALQASNEALAKGVEQNAALRGMGCTLIGAWIDKSGLRWTSVGDSLLLLYRFPDVIRLNADHSLGSYLDEQARQNRITVSEARAAPNRNALRSALTGSKIDLVDLHGEPLELHAGDWVLLASDGIASLAGDELADVIYRYRQATPEEMAEGLVGAVVRKNVPEQDNTTVVAVRVEGTPLISTSRLTTRILRPSAGTTKATATDGRQSGDRANRSLVGSALALSPAVWLGAAAGVLLVAMFLAYRMLPTAAPQPVPQPLPVFPQPTAVTPPPPPQGAAPPGTDASPPPSPPPYPPTQPEAAVPPPPAPEVRGIKPEVPPSRGGAPPDGSGRRPPPSSREAVPPQPGPVPPTTPQPSPGLESIIPPGSVPPPSTPTPPPAPRASKARGAEASIQ